MAMWHTSARTPSHISVKDPNVWNSRLQPAVSPSMRMKIRLMKSMSKPCSWESDGSKTVWLPLFPWVGRAPLRTGYGIGSCAPAGT